jgi:hypothetical protein
VDEALSKIPSDFADKCIMKSLEWCHKHHAKLGAGPAVPVAMPVLDEDGWLSGDESDDSD